jgi:CheY-like chemotaxis protein
LTSTSDACESEFRLGKKSEEFRWIRSLARGIREGTDADESVRVQRGPLPSPKPVLAAHGTKARILLVDDEEMIRKAGKVMLTALGYEVTLAADGFAAVELLKDHVADIDLVIVDLVMPEMDGAECLRRLKMISPRVPVLVCTGYADAQNTHTVLDEGALAIVRKPFGLDELAATVGGALQGGEDRRQPG